MATKTPAKGLHVLVPSCAMPLPGQDFASVYGSLSEQELLTTARAYDSLLEPAQIALRNEFARRNLQPPLIEEDDVESLRTLVTVRSYRDLSEAIVARSLLESAGIPVILRDENLVRLDWQISNFIGGLRLQVDSADVSSAQELLNQPVPESIPFSDRGQFEQPVCPHCGATEITFEGSSRGAALTALYLLSLPLPQGPKTWHCESCGARWENTEPSS